MIVFLSLMIAVTPRDLFDLVKYAIGAYGPEEIAGCYKLAEPGCLDTRVLSPKDQTVLKDLPQQIQKPSDVLSGDAGLPEGYVVVPDDENEALGMLTTGLPPQIDACAAKPFLKNPDQQDQYCPASDKVARKAFKYDACSVRAVMNQVIIVLVALLASSGIVAFTENGYVKTHRKELKSTCYPRDFTCKNSDGSTRSMNVEPYSGTVSDPYFHAAVQACSCELETADCNDYYNCQHSAQRLVHSKQHRNGALLAFTVSQLLLSITLAACVFIT
eukprot:NODE_446_length_8505_cov_0.322032.p2 type:complete len:273 gc:universal NODE_446_length_8505_cov_0.322032:6098-5280(-)